MTGGVDDAILLELSVSQEKQRRKIPKKEAVDNDSGDADGKPDDEVRDDPRYRDLRQEKDRGFG